MSLTKKELERIEELKVRGFVHAVNLTQKAVDGCECKINWDDKFTIYCDQHRAEAEEWDSHFQAI